VCCFLKPVTGRYSRHESYSNNHTTCNSNQTMLWSVTSSVVGNTFALHNQPTALFHPGHEPSLKDFTFGKIQPEIVISSTPPKNDTSRKASLLESNGDGVTNPSFKCTTDTSTLWRDSVSSLKIGFVLISPDPRAPMPFRIKQENCWNWTSFLRPCRAACALSMYSLGNHVRNSPHICKSHI
jgi:hypothetical protein